MNLPQRRTRRIDAVLYATAGFCICWGAIVLAVGYVWLAITMFLLAAIAWGAAD